ncbi:MAG: type II toxin-antitoxin system VapC family toxin [Candidatus Limnocylindrales bacterium]
MTVFGDTSAFFALLDGDAAEHRVAAVVVEELARSGERILTHEYVVVETIALVQRRLGLDLVRSFVDDLLAPVEIAWVDRELHLQARAAMLADGKRGVSLVDWTSFLVMREHGLAAAFAFDDDFRAQGFTMLPSA